MSVAVVTCLHNQPALSSFSYFDIGQEKFYPDNSDAEHEAYLENKVQPMVKSLESDPKRKLNLLISTPLLKILKYRSDLLGRIKKLVVNKQIELLSGAGDNSLSVLFSKTLFEKECDSHKVLIKKLFGVEPLGFINTAMLYSDKIGVIIREQGFKYALIPRVSWYINESLNSVFTTDGGKLKLFVPGAEENNNVRVVLSQNLQDLEAADKTVLFSDVKIDKNPPVYKLPNLVASDHVGRGIEAIVGNNLQKDFLNKLKELNTAVVKSEDDSIVEEFLWLGSLEHFSALANDKEDRYSSYTSLLNRLYDLEIRLR